MAQVLTQEEVDSLLSGLGGGTIEAETDDPASEDGVVAYDFTNQDRIIRGRMPTLDMIHDRFARVFRTTISGSLRRAVDVSIVNTSTIKFGDFMRSLPIPTSLHLIRLAPLKGLSVLVIEGKLVFSLLESYFGGQSASHYKLEGRDFTPIEQRVIKNVVDMVLQDYQTSWKPVHPVQIEFVRSEINPQFVNVVAPSDIVTTIECELDLEESNGRLIFCLPYSTMEPIRDKLRAGFQSESFEVDNEWVTRLIDQIKEAPVDLRVMLGKTLISGRDLLSLQVGDIIALDEDSQGPLKIFVEGHYKMTGRAGTYRGNRAVQVQDRIKLPLKRS